MNGTSGDDLIVNSGAGVSINAGTGNDAISLVGGVAMIEYASGDGVDTIYNYTSDSTLHITSGSINNHAIDGNDVILRIGSGSLRLIDAVDKTMKIIDNTGYSFSTLFSGNLNVYNSNDYSFSMM